MKIRNRYKTLSEPVKASLWFAISNILQKGIVLFSTPIFTRLLTTEEYGSFSVFQSWYGVLTILATLNLFLGGYGRGLIEHEKDKNRLTSSLLELSTLLTTIVLAIYLSDIKLWTTTLNLSPMLMVAMFIQLYTLPAYEFWATSQRYEFRYRKLVCISILMSVGSIVLGIIAVIIFPHKLEARIYSDAICKVLVGLSLYIHIIKKGNYKIEKKYWIYGLRFNIPLVPHYLSSMILNLSDRIMINNMVSSSAAAKYSVSYTIGMMMQLITNAINNSFTPYTFIAIRDKSYEKLRKNATVLYIFVGIISILSMAFAPELIMVFAGKQYYEAVWVIPPIATSVYFIFLYSLFSNVEYYFKKTKFIAIASTFCAIINLVLNYIFIPYYGYFTAGYTTLVCYILYTVMHYIFMKKICVKENINVNLLYDFKGMIVSSTIVLGIMVLMIFTYRVIIVRYSIIVSIFALVVISRKKLIMIFITFKK
ncbi:lipopolysaccharide biosynthesis protein [Gorillibacterium timonense]|uniref:lipopolysaccharide biosynthesis protein n=1 Tax=Gorillibacterium timonense TaxID=1689269 RepID=UPI00131C1FC9|nr:oligosaccharide flippase family protein [Gorillibacterium timonense]